MLFTRCWRSTVTFGPGYAGIYDALYHQKDYAAESAFVLAQLESHIPAGASLMDLGCGTGLHAVEMARMGKTVTGIDRSADMIARAKTRRSLLPPDLAARLVFKVGDMCSANEHRNFDAVVSLFHVICYMVDDVMLGAALTTVRRHLRPGGMFLFDFWYADAILSDPPQVRERAFDISGRHVIRTATPRWEPERSVVHVTYDMATEDGGEVPPSETHSVRYFTSNELTGHMIRAGFSVLRFGEWLTDAMPTQKSFGVYCLARAT